MALDAPDRAAYLPALSHRRAQRALKRPDGQRALFVAQTLEYIAARDGAASSWHLSSRVISAWGLYLREHWRSLTTIEQVIRRGWFTDYASVAETSEQRDEAIEALRWLDRGSA